MKTFFRKFAAVFSALLLLSAVFLPTVISAESLYIKKVVSVVYDDSGSMRNRSSKNWAYASYAMQTFCGLLNADDKLFMTYMSGVVKYGDSYEPVEMDLSASGIQNSINQIRTHSEYNTTPYKSIEIGMDKLREVSDSDENVQYWLVIITDGVDFDEYVGQSSTAQAKLDSDLAAFSKEKMANGTTPQITYLAIGDGAITATKNEKDGIFVYETAGAEDIINTMSDIADKVSGRSRLQNADIELIDSNTVQITSEIPLRNIAVLSQKSSAKVTSASYDGGTRLSVQRSVSFLYPSVAGNTTDTSLKGGGFMISDGGETIDAGTYVLKFDTAVTLDSFVIMFEPALEVRVSVDKNGKPIDLGELGDLRDGDKISVSYKIYEFGTSNEVTLDKLPEGTAASLTISENGAEVQKAEGTNMAISGYTLKEVPTEISAKVTIPGFAPIELKKEFTPQEYVYIPPSVYTTKAEYGSTVTKVSIDDIDKNQDLSVVFTFYKDYVRIENKAEVEALAPSIKTSPEGNGGTTVITSDGKLIYTPKTANAGATRSYDVTVTCEAMSDNGKVSASKTYSVTVPEYTVKAEFGSGTSQVHLDDIAKTHDLSIVFTFYKDLVRIDNKAAVEALAPSLGFSADGNGGTTEITADGKLIFRPNTTSGRTTGGGTYDVTVTCEFEYRGNKINGSKTYYIQVPEYTIEAEYGSDVTKIHLDDVSGPHDLSIIFTFYKDGVLLQSEAEILALMPKVSVSPVGNEGDVEITKGGQLIFKPTKAKGRTSGGGAFDVSVVCEAGGTQITKTYAVQVPEYLAVTVDAGQAIAKHQFYGNKIGVSFYITRDGVKLDKSSLGEYTVTINEEYSHLKLDVTVLDDGTVVCIPYDENERKMHFGNWFTNWIYYFGLEDSDVVISFENEEGTATSLLPVRNASWKYILLNVVLPMLLWAAIIAFIIWWIYAVITKPRFADNGMIYYGSVIYDDRQGEHIITSWKRTSLKKHNSFGYIITPTKTPKIISVGGGVKVSAGYSGKISFKGKGKHYVDMIVPSAAGEEINTPAELFRYFRNGNPSLPIRMLTMDNKVTSPTVSSTSNLMCHILVKDTSDEGGVERIEEATLFCYSFTR